MTPRDLIDDLRSRINPAYSAQRGTESYERRLCAEALEAQADEIDRLRAIETSAKNLIAQKGRHNTQIAYEWLAALIKTPNA